MTNGEIATDSPSAAATSAEAPVAVVIVNFQTPTLTVAAARSVLHEVSDLGGSLVIVDNASGDGSAEAIERFIADSGHARQIRLIRARENLGFAAGNNLGFARQAARYYLLLNSDATARPGALRALLRAAESAPEAGIVTPRIVNPLGRMETSRFRRYSIMSEFVSAASSGPVTRLLPNAEIPIAPDDWVTPPAWVSFSAVLINAAAIAAVGPMDAAFFLYYEDCEYCDRIRRAGFDIARAPDAEFIHAAGGSTGLDAMAARGERLPAYFYRSRNLYYRRRYGAAGPVFANAAWRLGRAIAQVRGLFGRPPPQTPQRWGRDMWIGWRG